jgi:hypothetical protein
MPSVTEKRISLAIVLFITVAQAAILWQELFTSSLRNNDAVNHYTMTKQMVDTIEHGGNPLDFWSPEVSLGVPMVRTYQPLAHILVAAAYFALGKTVPLMTVLGWARFLAVLVLPWSFYVALLWMDFAPLTAAAGALLIPMIAGPGQGAFGLDYRSWVGYGIYPQSVATALLLLALGLSFRAIRTGKHVAIAGATLGLTALAHLMYGWMGAIMACGIALLPDSVPRALRIRRTVAIGAVAAVLSAFQLVPLFTDGYLINRARFEPADKFDSYGATTVLQWLFSGELLDHDRGPALSFLALLGAGILGWQWFRTHKLAVSERLTLVGFVFWLLVFFGRPTWGPLLILLGVSRDFHLHRVIANVEIFAVMLAGIGLSTLWRSSARRWGPIAACIITALLVTPMAIERVKYLNWHEAQGWKTREVVKTQGPALDHAISLALERGGRVYAGIPSTWENKFTVGSTPVSTFIILRLAPAVSFAYNSSVFPVDAMNQFDEWNPAHYRLFNIRSVLTSVITEFPPFLTPVEDFGWFRLLDAPGKGYFGLVDVRAAAHVDRSAVADITNMWLKSGWLEHDQFIRLDFDNTAPKDLPRVTPGGPMPPLLASTTPPGSVTNEKQTGQVYEADLNANWPAVALFRMSYHFNWRAYIDGRPQPTMMLTPGFLGVNVPAGTHHILCRYEPGNTKLVMAGAGFGLTLLLIVGERVSARRLVN